MRVWRNKMTKEKLSNMEYSILNYFLTKAFFVGITFSCISRIIKQDSWIVPLISILIGLFIIIFITYIINYKESESIIKKINALFKSKFRYIISSFIIIIGIIYNIANTTNLNNFIHTQFLNKTPILIISILFMLVTLYTLTKGINVITKTSTIIFYISIFLVLITFIGLIPKFQFSNLKPNFQFNENSLFNSLRLYYTFNITPIFLLTIIPKSNIKNPKIYKSISISYIISTITIFMSIILTIGVLGYELINLYEYPEFQVLKEISLIGISSRIESILVIQWIFDLFVYNVFIIYFVCNSIKHLIKKDLNINLIYTAYCLIIAFLLNYLSKYNIFLENFILKHVYKYISFITIIIICFLCLKIKINKLRHKNS